MLGTGGPASSSRGEVVPASSSGGEPPVEDVVVAAVQLIGEMGLEEPPPPDDDEVHVSGAPPMARRPDLDNSELLRHIAFVFLRQGFCKAGECQFLEHGITGEQAQCDRASKWSLHFGTTSGLGYIVSDKHKVWVNTLLICSLHECKGTNEDFIVQRVPVSTLEQNNKYVLVG